MDLVGGLVLVDLVRLALISTGDPDYLPALILLGAALVPASFVTFVIQRRLPYDVSSGLLILVALVEGVIGDGRVNADPILDLDLAHFP